MASVGPSGADAARPPAAGRLLKGALVATAGVGVAACLYVIASALAKPGSAAGMSGLNHGAMAKLQVLGDPVPAAPVAFKDADGRTLHLSDFKGRAVVLNLWATWCAPCRKEMPTLAALQRAEAGHPVKVVAVSMDTPAEADKARAFIAGYPPLGFFQDDHYGFMTGMKPQLLGFPTTVLIDRSGQERAVYAGDANWTSPEAKAAVDRLAGL